MGRLALALIVCFTTSAAASEIGLRDLRVEHLTNPLGLDVLDPRFSWKLVDARRGAVQTAYQIQVGSAPGLGDIWDSGRVGSSDSVDVAYGGPPLQSRQRYHWRVRVWGMNGVASPFEPAFWETGLLKASEWRAQWIGISQNAALVRKSFTITKPIARARAYVTARGYYRLRLNGQRVGGAEFAPEWTDYRLRSVYQTYDVTAALRSGENVVGAWLGKGWYGSKLDWKSLSPYRYGPAPMRLLLQMHIEFADKTELVVVSDGSWKATQGPVRESTLYGGETYNAAYEQPGWDGPGFDARSWSAVTTAAFNVQLTGQTIPQIKVIESRRPVKMTSPSSGVFVFDMGQNMTGWVRLRAKGSAGKRITLRHAEVLKQDGNIDTYSLRSAKATDYYYMKGSATPEIYEPRFTYHGFRYVEVTGYPGTPTLEDVTGRVVHTDLPITGTFSSSNTMVDAIWDATLWTQRDNWFSVPKGAPQRDERMAWLGDAHIFWRAACYNMDNLAFTRKWMRDVVEAQTSSGSFRDISPDVPGLLGNAAAPYWGDAGVAVPWTAWRQYGDTRIIHDSYSAMQRWMAYIKGGNPNFLWENRVGNNWGDWLARTGNPRGDKPVLATAVWAQDAKMMAEMARAIGREGDAVQYDQLFTSIRNAFVQKYVSASGWVGSGNQTPQAMALQTGLVPKDRLQAAVGRLVADVQSRGNQLSTGFVGIRYLLPALSDAGRDDVAYSLLLQTKMPSWGYMVQNGGTTMWERWDNDVVNRTRADSMCSFNHFAFGVVVEWLYRYAAGIDLAASEPGFRSFVIHPRIDGRLNRVDASYESVRGLIRSGWQTRNGDLTLDVTVPPNTEAMVHVPTSDPAVVRESGRRATETGHIELVGVQGKAAVYRVPAGAYSFTVGGLTAAGPPRVGRPLQLHLTRQDRAGAFYQMALSLSNNVGILVPGLGTIPLDADFLFLLSVAGWPPGVFANFSGQMPPAGEATGTFHVPAGGALVGTPFHAAAVTFTNRGLDYISNGLALELAR